MSELLLPEGATVQNASSALRQRLELREREQTVIERSFYDTFDGLLHAAGLIAEHQDGRFGVGDSHAIPWAAPPRRVLAIELSPSPLRELLEPVIGVRALLPQARVRVRMHGFDVLDDRHKTIARLTFEEPELALSERRVVALRPRARVTGVRGYDRDLARVRKLLEHELRYRAAHQPLADEAVVAAGGTPAGHSSKPRVPLKRRQPSVQAVAAVLASQWQVVHANLEGTIADIDAEFLHDFRVAVRRSRAAQREFKLALPSAQLERFRTEFKWLQEVTGEPRDMDVYVLEFEATRALVPEPFRPDLEPLLGVLRSHRLAARREMVRALRSDRARDLWHEWPEFLRGLASGSLSPGPAGSDPVGPLTAERIARVYRRMVRIGRGIDAGSPPEALHELRKKGKELRYLLELFGAELFPGAVVKPMIKTLKQLQDVLGRHQDREVQAATVRGLREEVSALPGGPGALMAMGLLVERIAEDQRSARAEFADRFATFASKEQRKLVKETFT
jgi:CHAD domain-containing protein